LFVLIAHIISTLVIQLFSYKHTERKALTESIIHFQESEVCLDTTSLRKVFRSTDKPIHKYIYPNKDITIISSDNLSPNMMDCMKKLGLDILNSDQIQEKANLTSGFQYLRLEKYIYTPFFVYLVLSRNYSVSKSPKHTIYFTPDLYRNHCDIIFGYCYYSMFTSLPRQGLVQKK
jgi:hypothetical protein